MKDSLNTTIDLDSIDGGKAPEQGLTPMHRQSIDESRADEILVEDTLDDKDYPEIRDIADDDAVSQSYEDE